MDIRSLQLPFAHWLTEEGAKVPLSRRKSTIMAWAEGKAATEAWTGRRFFAFPAWH